MWKTLWKWGKTLCFSPKPVENLWILWKNVGKTVWKACVNPVGTFVQLRKKCEM